MFCSPQVVEPLSAYLPRQLNHLEIPRAQTAFSVDSPVRNVVALAGRVSAIWMMPRSKIFSLPPQLKVLVHQSCQAAPVSVLQGRPEGSTFSISAKVQNVPSNTLNFWMPWQRQKKLGTILSAKSQQNFALGISWNSSRKNMLHIPESPKPLWHC